MAKPDDGGPAFPRAAYVNPTGDPRGVKHGGTGCFSNDSQWGMSLRDWFAGQVIGPTVMATLRGGTPESVATDIFAASRAAYRIASAMLAEREKGGSDA